mmetsp:Transcript_55643/g.146871  ORF Transcript_55643/g.146871 Transcript_55643/m.146871 type:complete len:82 (+) Transcript_55643:380-625(+)
MVFDDKGNALGVIGTGLMLDFLTDFLFTAVEELRRDVAFLSNRTDGFYLAALDARGLLLGITTNGSITRLDPNGSTYQLNW